jgi:hypothetical protein
MPWMAQPCREKKRATSEPIKPEDPVTRICMVLG